MFLVKLILANVVIIAAVQLGRKMPSLSGLIATMPITTLIVLFWLYADNPGDYRLMKDFTKGVLFGMVPSVLFFMVAWFCFRKQVSINLTVSLSFAVWLAGAIVHQVLLRDGTGQ